MLFYTCLPFRIFQHAASASSALFDTNPYPAEHRLVPLQLPLYDDKNQSICTPHSRRAHKIHNYWLLLYWTSRSSIHIQEKSFSTNKLNKSGVSFFITGSFLLYVNRVVSPSNESDWRGPFGLE